MRQTDRHGRKNKDVASRTLTKSARWLKESIVDDNVDVTSIKAGTKHPLVALNEDDLTGVRPGHQPEVRVEFDQRDLMWFVKGSGWIYG